MNITSDIHTAIVVATRFNEHKTAAETAFTAIRKFTINAGNFVVTEKELETLKSAAEILDAVRNRMGESDVQKYLQQLQPVTPEPAHDAILIPVNP